MVLSQNIVKAGQGFEPRHGFRIDGFVDGWRSCRRPAEAFQSIPRVDDLQRHRPVTKSFDFDVTFGMFFEVHEHERCEFQSAHDHLNGSACVAASAPRVLDVGDLVWVDAEGVGQQAVAQVNTGLNPVMLDPVVWPIEDVVRHHFEGGQVPSRTSDGIDVRQADARL